MVCKWHLCNQELDGKKTKFCSKQCKNKFFVDKRRKDLKIELVNIKGGKCERCGYSECIRALTFHHRNPDEKEFGISAKGNTMSLEKLKQEISKCHLLCFNCHMFIHDNKDSNWINY